MDNKMTIDKEFESWALNHEIDITKNPAPSYDSRLYNDDETDNMWIGWQAARAIDAKRIVELEALANRPVTDNTQLIANMEAQITDLESEIAKLNAIIEDMKVVDNVFSK